MIVLGSVALQREDSAAVHGLVAKLGNIFKKDKYFILF